MRSSFSNLRQWVLQKLPADIKKHYWQYRTVNVPLMGYVRYPKEVELLALLPSHPKTIVDIGANRGDWSNAYTDLLRQDSSFFMFEPIPELYHSLQKRFASHPNVHIYNIAISNKKGVSTFNVSESDDFSSFETTANSAFQVPSVKTQIPVTTDTLDNVHRTMLQGIHIDLLKIDTQGHEAAILSQAQEALKVTKAILIEWNIVHLYQSNADFITIHQRLSEHGFVLGSIVSQARWGHILSYADALYFNKQFLPDSHFTFSQEA